MWAAMSGKEQLPPFPEPEFAGKPNMVHQIGKACLVTAPEGRQLQPMVSVNMCRPMLGQDVDASHSWPCIMRTCTWPVWPLKAGSLLLLVQLCLLQQLLLQTLFGDMLSDLPEVSSFSVAEELEYKSEPQTPYQARQVKLANIVGADA